MVTPETALNPREALNLLYLKLRNAYSKVASAKPGDVKADKEIIQEVDMMENIMQKLDFGLIRKLRDDASIDSNKFTELQELERLLNEIVLGKKITLRKDHYLYRTAKRIRNSVRGSKNKAQREGTLKLREIQKKQEQMKREQQKLLKEKVEANEKAGRK
jgi:hypothetical protein